MFTTRSSILLLLIAVPLLAANKFPSYLGKCKNDEKLNECFLQKAQAGLSYILKGDPEIKIPSFLPLKVPFTVELGTNDFKYDIENLVISPNEIPVLEAKWDTAKKTIYLKFKFSQVTWDFDYIFKGNVLGKQMNEKGHGKQRYESLDNGWFSYEMKYEIVQVEGVDYAKITSGNADYSAEKITYTFENEDLSAEIEKDWEKFAQILQPQLKSLIFKVVSIPFEAIFAVTPFDKLFN